MIKAEAYSDDRAIEVSFDATPYFEQAPLGAIVQLIRIDWGGDYAADDVALYFAERDEELGHELFSYLAREPRFPGGDSVGFECHVNPDSAIEWLEANRPEALAFLPDQEDAAGRIARLPGELFRRLLASELREVRCAAIGVMHMREDREAAWAAGRTQR